MDSKIIQSVSQEIYRRFPQVKGCRPEVTRQTAETYLLVFTNKGRQDAQTPIASYVRVVIDEKGHILKASSSK